VALYLVDRDLPGMTIDQFTAAQRAGIAAAARFTAAGSPVRYIRSTFQPQLARSICLFEAPNAHVVEAVNTEAQIPFIRISEALELAARLPEQGLDPAEVSS
jgi:hypothetical protein